MKTQNLQIHVEAVAASVAQRCMTSIVPLRTEVMSTSIFVGASAQDLFKAHEGVDRVPFERAARVGGPDLRDVSANLREHRPFSTLPTCAQKSKVQSKQASGMERYGKLEWGQRPRRSNIS